jgi:hypothetical protein
VENETQELIIKTFDMNRIILIGNGFDLAHGLPTSYAQFIDKLWEEIIDRIKSSYLNNYTDDCITIQQDKDNIYLYVLRDVIGSAQTYEELLKNLEKCSLTYQIHNLFLEYITIQQQRFKNWVDIENEYYKFLTYEFDPKRHEWYKYVDIKILNKDFESLKQKLNDYLIGITQNEVVIQSETIMSIIHCPLLLKDFTDVGKKSIASNEYEKIVRETNGGGDAWEDEMSRKTRPLLENYKHFSGQELKESILYDLQKEDLAEQYFDLQFKNTLFLNFNYTDTEKYYTDSDDENTETIHIHGEVNNSTNPIIFGYGDELEENYSKLENLQDNEYLENIKSIQYLETDNYKKMLSFIDSDKYQVIILGHSCGNSDRTLLNTLFEHENCVSIKPYYFQYKDPQTGEIKDNYSDIVRNISRSFRDKKSMRDKVVNKNYTDWFSRDID